MTNNSLKMSIGNKLFGWVLSIIVLNLCTVFVPCNSQLPPFDPNNFQFAFTPNQTNQQGLGVADSFVDRRNADGWWMLYPFGEIYYDQAVWDRPNHDTQIDLDFYFPYYGFRFNYTFILPNGIVAFSRPEWIQPPYTFPNPKWPDRSDGSFIAPFFAMASFQYIGDVGISNVWYRSVHRPKGDAGYWEIQGRPQQNLPQQQQNPFSQYGQAIRRQPGYVEDHALLDNITRDIQEGVNGANGFRTLHALIVTWERMAFGGAPKIVELESFDEAKKWQNTYQMVLATDEIRSYVIFNYAYLNWTSSRESGSISGRGGYQSAIAGFNGGNATGFTPLPYSGEGEIYKLSRFSSVSVPGRWTYRVDEQIIFGGCSNASMGYMTVAPDRATMLGGLAVNVSGPCFRSTDTVVVLFDEFLVNCKTLNMHRARCMLPKFHKVGMINTKVSRDGGASFPYISTFFIVPPDRAAPGVILRKDVLDYLTNAFDNPTPDELVMTWSPFNLTGNLNSRVQIELWGYWEDNERHLFQKVATLAENLPNSGEYVFNPKTLQRIHEPSMKDMYKQFEFGTVRVSIAEDPNAGVLYSMVTSFAWYFVTDWESYYGEDWALQRCIDWFENDGRWRNVWMDLEACPCTLDQAVYDFGRYMPFLECDMTGDGGCYFHRGAQHCVMSVHSTWAGAQTVCCYDFEGWLMHSDDYESLDVIKYYSPGVPYRAHIFGSYPYKIPPYIPTMSNWMHDVGPYHMCCRFAGRCEFLMWRRQTHGCQGYLPPSGAIAYGDAHFITFDGVRYTFNGKGYYVLSMSDHPWHKLMVQVRLEQPPKASWGSYPNATIITGISVQENDSDVVQVLARKEFRRWRYRMDVLVRGIPRFFDTPDMKVQMFRGLNVWSPSRNFDQSEIHIQLKSGVGIKVSEGGGTLDVQVLVPKSYNMTDKNRKYFTDPYGQSQLIPTILSTANTRPQDFYKTYGLLGVYNEDPNDDLMPLDSMVPVRTEIMAYKESRKIYYEFGQKWRVDGSNPFIGPILFQDSAQPIHNPLLFSERNYEPDFEVTNIPANVSRYRYLNINQVRSVCGENPTCQHDYFSTGRKDIAQRTLNVEESFMGGKDKGGKLWVSCGALLKAYGATKSPPGNNYLEGATVTFGCRPEYFMHGSQTRTCVNGSWTPGWHVWCRLRTEEIALKWVTGVFSTIGIIGSFAGIFACCYYMNKRVRENKMDRATGLYSRMQSLIGDTDSRKPSMAKSGIEYMGKQSTVYPPTIPELDSEADTYQDVDESVDGAESIEHIPELPEPRNFSRVTSRDTLLRGSLSTLPEVSSRLSNGQKDSDEIILAAEPSSSSRRKASAATDIHSFRSPRKSSQQIANYDRETQQALLSDEEGHPRHNRTPRRKETWSPMVHLAQDIRPDPPKKKYSLSALENKKVMATRPQVLRKSSMMKALEGDSTDHDAKSARSSRKASSSAKTTYETASGGESSGAMPKSQRRKSTSANAFQRHIQQNNMQKSQDNLSSSRPSLYNTTDIDQPPERSLKSSMRKSSMSQAQQYPIQPQINDNPTSQHSPPRKKSSVFKHIAEIPGSLIEAAVVYPDLAQNGVEDSQDSAESPRYGIRAQPTSYISDQQNRSDSSISAAKLSHVNSKLSIADRQNGSESPRYASKSPSINIDRQSGAESPIYASKSPSINKKSIMAVDEMLLTDTYDEPPRARYPNPTNSSRVETYTEDENIETTFTDAAVSHKEEDEEDISEELSDYSRDDRARYSSVNEDSVKPKKSIYRDTTV